jgi:hypothetical protein
MIGVQQVPMLSVFYDSAPSRRLVWQSHDINGFALTRTVMLASSFNDGNLQQLRCESIHERAEL